jgi:hypothetical protein
MAQQYCVDRHRTHIEPQLAQLAFQFVIAQHRVVTRDLENPPFQFTVNGQMSRLSARFEGPEWFEDQSAREDEYHSALRLCTARSRMTIGLSECRGRRITIENEAGSAYARFKLGLERTPLNVVAFARSGSPVVPRYQMLGRYWLRFYPLRIAQQCRRYVQFSAATGHFGARSDTACCKASP